MRFGTKIKFDQYESLQVIWRSFCDSKLKSDVRNRLSAQKSEKITYYMPQSEIW